MEKKVLKFNLVKVNFWDMGGDPAYLDIRNEFYKDTNAALLVFDLTNKASFDRIDKWIAEYNEFAKDKIFIVLAGNKSDLSTREVSVDVCLKKAVEIGAQYFRFD